MRNKHTMGIGIGFAAAVAISLSGAPSAHAATTGISPPNGGEDGHQDIFSQTYGGTFTTDGLNFTNGTVTAQRVDDNNDQLIPAGVYDAGARAIFAKYGQSFGYLPGTDGGTFQEIFRAKGKQYSVEGEATSLDLTDGTFRWARNGANGMRSSLNSDNPDNQDHVITYRILGLEGDDVVTMLFFEDLVAGQDADDDFQDLVVEVRGRSGGPIAVPTPAAVGPGMALLTALGLFRRRRPNG